MAVLVQEYRNNIVENYHNGRICIVDYNGKVIHSIGDTEQLTYFRSASKPIQLLPLFEYQLDRKYGLTEEELTIMAASHAGESYHIKTIESIMNKCDIQEQDFITKPTYPARLEDRIAMYASGTQPRRIHHNCSGKHLALMLIARHLGNYTKDAHKNYWQVDCPAQLEVRRVISKLTDYPSQQIGIGVDGCGVPVFATPMRNISLAYLRLARPELIEEQALREGARKIASYYNRHPLFVRGTNYLCSIFNTDDNIIAKGGAQGVYCFGMKKEKLGVSVKVEDGSEHTMAQIVEQILIQLGYDNQSTIDKIDSICSKTIINDNDTPVGKLITCFNLK
ncbi:MAG: asparaginase [Clostridia bacterium]|nr:asparaginase [Clostridia bacterium]